jgi:hypothetical protein
MSIELDTLMKLRAWALGHAIETCETLPWPRVSASSVRILAFVRMGGEAAPWGFAIGSPGQTPQIVTVPDPRDREAVASLCVELAEALLPHVGHPEYGTAGEDAARTQLWVPGASHLEALHLLALRFTRARRTTPERVIALRRLARAAGWLFRESRRPGQIRVMDAAARLREAFAVPSELVRQQHLGYLLAWIVGARTEGGAIERARRALAAGEAEQQSISWTLDPELEERTLEPLLEAWNRGRVEQSNTDEPAAKIQDVLTAELLRRWKLTEAAWRVLTDDPRPSNPMLAPLEALARDEHQWQYAQTEQKLLHVDESSEDCEVFVTDPETDRSPAAASSRYWRAVCANDRSAELIHGDRWLHARAVAAGAALDGVVRAVRVAKVGRAEVIRWELACSGALPTKFREGAKVALRGMPCRNATIESVRDDGDARVFVLEITGWKRARGPEGIPAASDRAAYEGTRVGFVAETMPELALKKSYQSWSDEGPGAWLTHATARSGERSTKSPNANDGGSSLLDAVRHW